MQEVFDEHQLDIIQWWLFEDVEKKIYDNDEIIYINTIEDLYKYLNK